MLSWFSETLHELQNSTNIDHKSLGVIKHFAIFGAPHLIKLLGGCFQSWQVSSHFHQKWRDVEINIKVPAGYREKKKSNRGFESQDCFFGIRVIIVFVLVAFFARIALNMWQYVAQSYILS